VAFSSKEFNEFSELCKKYRITGFLSHRPDKNLYMFLGDYFRWLYRRLGHKDNLERATYYYEFISGKSEKHNELFAASVEITVEIHNLYEKLNIPPKPTHFHNAKLLEILKALDSDKSFSNDDEKWLSENDFENVLGRYYMNRYSVTNDPWMAIKAGKYWRKAKEPALALEATKNINADSDKARSAILTNKGGAYRDLGKLEDAKRQAEEAIKLQPKSFYAYNLLGAIYYQEGFPETGDLHFTTAVELGSSRKAQEDMIRTAIHDSGDEEREAIAKYLLNKDPKTYSWVKVFTKSNG